MVAAAGRHADVTVGVGAAAASAVVDDGALSGQLSALAVPSPSSPAQQPAMPSR